jgi:hypothetical protein
MVAPAVLAIGFLAERSAEERIMDSLDRHHEQGRLSWWPISYHAKSRCRLLRRFLDAGKQEAPQALLTGVQKAPRHEVAGNWALAGQRVLWGFDVGADLDDRRDAGRIRPACLHGQEIGRAQ